MQTDKTSQASAQAILALPETGKDEDATAADDAKSAAPAAGAEGAPAAEADEAQQQATPEGEQKQESAAEGQPEGKTAEADIEVTLPDGVKEDAELLGGFKAIAKEHGLTSEQAQKYVDLFVAAQNRAVEQAREQAEHQAEEWAEQCKAHPEFGGAKFTESVAIANKGLARFGTPELQQLLTETGLCNHPLLVSLFYRVGKAIGEDTIAGTHGSNGPTASGPEAYLRAMYPTMFQRKE